MANIKLDVDTLTSQAASMNSLANEFSEIQKKLENELTATNANWSSGISSSFSNTISSMKTVFVEMIQELQDNAKRAEGVAYKYKEADGSISHTNVADISTEDAALWIRQKQNYEKMSKHKTVQKNIEGRNYISLQDNMKVSMKQSTYEMYAYNSDGTRYNAGCMATCYAIAGSIITGQSKSPLNYWSNTYHKANSNGLSVSGWINGNNSSFGDFYNRVTSGKPVMVHFTHGKTGGEHWVVITGIADDADPNNLTANDFIVADPGTGQYRSLSNCMDSYNTSKVTAKIDGYKCFN